MVRTSPVMPISAAHVCVCVLARVCVRGGGRVCEWVWVCVGACVFVLACARV
jgi:hypothetical protein